MLYAWIDGCKRAPIAKGERTICPDCGGTLTAVLPAENVPHWRHRGGDCDAWSEAEGPWHLAWKERFDPSCREISLRDPTTGERHRADVLVGGGTSQATVLELQHSHISEEDRQVREAFYMREHRMFWLVHVHNEKSFTGYSFGFSLDFRSNVRQLYEKEFAVMSWTGSSKQFIEKWKKSNAHVFFHWGSGIFYLASDKIMTRLKCSPKSGQFALCALSHDEFLRAVHGTDAG
jgi:competence CoiA-like predicted nuclease